MSLAAMKLPIVKVAAAAVIGASILVSGAMTGLLPSVSSSDKPADAVQVASDIRTPAPISVPERRRAPVVKRTPAKPAAETPIVVASAPVVCHDCGVIESIDKVTVKGEASGKGAVIGGIAGAVAGNQISKGKRKTFARIAGAAAGAIAGNEIEKRRNKSVEYQISLRMEDGSKRTVTQASNNGLHEGSRARIVDGEVVSN